MNAPRMLYYGPWDKAGHYFFTEEGRSGRSTELAACPWDEYEIDGKLQPGCRVGVGGFWTHGAEVEGAACVHYKAGWTALSFWDRSVDTRGACNSTYLAEGEFTFDEMVEMAKTRFAVRWNKMKFPVRLAGDRV